MTNRCPTCGATYAADAKFCTRDGTRLQAVMPPTPGSSPAVPGPGKESFDGRTGTIRAQVRPTSPRVGDPPAASASRKPISHANMVGQVLDGRYRIVRKVGEGGMSFVYLAQDVASDERYAIKILSPSLSQDKNAMARLRREAGLGIRLAHPNVCHIMRLGETEDGLVYVVMPFVEGEILADRTNRLGHIPLDQTVTFVKQMADGLHIAHELKIVHRDLKPENIMICRNQVGEDYAVVMDFGLAKERKAGNELEKLTATGIILGTPEFMSPEQLRGKPLDGRTDIYSLALMTYEMLTGKLPFEGRTQQELMIARLRADPIPVRKMRPDLNFPAGVEKVLLKAMERNPDDRFQTAPEFAQAFAAAATDSGAGEAGQSGFIGKIFGR